MSETTLNQEQPEPTPTTSPAEQETTPATIGGQVIERDDKGTEDPNDDTETHTVFPVTEVPAEQPEEQVSGEPSPAIEQAPEATEAAPAESTPEPTPVKESEVTIIGVPETSLSTEAIAEVKPAAPETQQQNTSEVDPVTGLAFTAAAVGAGVKKWFTRNKKG
jgi:hypothetical protein